MEERYNINLIGFALGNKSQLTESMSNVICFDKESKQITTQGVDFLPEKKVIAQLGIWFQDMWMIRENMDSISTILNWGDVSDVTVSAVGNTLQLTGNIFYGKSAFDITFGLVGFEDEPPSDIRIAPYQVNGTTLNCRIFANGTIENGTGFVVSIYK